MSIIYVRNPSTGQLEPLEVGGSADAVLYTEQTLTEKQQAQARENIGAAAGTAHEPETNDIPKVFFGGPLQQTKTEAVVPFRYISATQDISGYAKIKAQGGSSMTYAKKNQTVKLYKDAECTEKLKVDFKGWGEQNKFCFKANWIDITHARNIVSARLWGDVVKARANYTELPALLRTSPNQGAIDGFPVKVYAAGIYQGRYTINIPKDKWMASMDDNLDNHCILCGEGYYSACFRAAANIDGTDWSDEIHDTVPASIKTRWNAVISFVRNSTDAEFRANLGNYFDVPSLLDYHLFGLASCGLDNYAKNQLYMTYDGQKWLASVYDMDSTWGLYWHGINFVDADYPRTSYEDFASSESPGDGNLLYIRLEKLFAEELYSRWAELKNGALSIENIINHFERFTDIAPAELVKEDYAATTGEGLFTGIPSQTTNNIQQIRSFALARQAWTDGYVASLLGVETTITLDKDSLSFNAYGSETLVATVTPAGQGVTWSSSNEDIAYVENGVVTALSNGSATITATCNGVTASCSVSVSGISSPQVYRLPAAKTFNGTSDYVDTGLKLFDTQKDFTILLAGDFTQGYAANSQGTILHGMLEVYPWSGMALTYYGDSSLAVMGCKDAATNMWQWASAVDANKVAIRFVDGVFNEMFYLKNGEISRANPSNAQKSTYYQHTRQLVVGCFLDGNGNPGRYWKGTIYELSVRCVAMSDAKIEEWLMG